MKNNLQWTGERLVTQMITGFGTHEHLHRYAIALEICKNKKVLDIASGEGYGSNLIADVAEFVTGVDISEEAVKHAKNKYNRQNLEFRIGSTIAIPLSSNSIDVVISFETIEHIFDQDLFLSEIKRVLREDGTLLISTPDKNNYSIRDPNNKFHLKELTTNEFENLIKTKFNYTHLNQQRLFIGSVISASDDLPGLYRFYDGNFSEIREALDMQEIFNRVYFNIIVASDSNDIKMNIPQISLFSAYKTYEKDFNSLKMQLQENESKLKSIMSSRTVKVAFGLKKYFYLYPIKTFRTLFQKRKNIN